MSVIPPRYEQPDQDHVIGVTGQAQQTYGTPSFVGQGPQPFVQTGPAPIPEIGETLLVKNVGTSVLRFAWNSRLYEIHPGHQIPMPFDGVKVYVGDPRATNNVRTMRDTIGIVSFLPDRATEVRRLRLLYGAPFGEYMTAADVGGIFQEAPVANEPVRRGRAWDNVRVPEVEVYNIHGQRVITVLEDPEGNQSIPVTVTGHDKQQLDRVEQLVAVVEGRDRIIAALAERLGIDPNSPAVDNADDFLDENPPVPDIELHEDGSPVMVMDPRSEEVKPKRRPRREDPSELEDLPETEM